VLDMLFETSMLGRRVVEAPVEANVRLLSNQWEILDDPDRYWRLVDKLNYITIIIHDIAFAVSIVSQFLSAPRTTHWNAVVRISW